MFSFLKKPYPYYRHVARTFLSVTLVSIFIALFLLTFQPFGISSLNIPNKTIYVLGYGLVTFVAFMMHEFSLPLLFPSFYNEKSWNAGKQIFSILLVILLIGTGNMFYTGIFIESFKPSAGRLLYFQLVTMAVAVFPVTFMILWNQIRLIKRNQKESEKIKDAISSIPSQPVNAQLQLRSDNEKEVFAIEPEHLLFIESADNYSVIHYLKNSVLSRHILRSSLSRMELQISNPFILRCHRSYIVNLKKINSVSGNAQGYRLKPEATDVEIPVSRSHAKKILEKISR